MNYYHAHADPPRSLATRLRSLNDNLLEMAVRLKEAIASAVSNTLGQAIRDLLRRMLGDEGSQTEERDRYERQPRERSYERSDHERHWRDDEDPWNDERQDWQPKEEPRNETKDGHRWNTAFRMAIQSALWWLRTQPCRRPVLTTTLVALAAGSAALLAGPTLAASVSVVATMASLLLTSESVRSACDILSG